MIVTLLEILLFPPRLDALVLRSPKESILEIFPLLELLHFDLYLANRGFLDQGWELLIYKKYELVPCADLGLMICSVRGRIIVSKVFQTIESIVDSISNQCMTLLQILKIPEICIQFSNTY